MKLVYRQLKEEDEKERKRAILQQLCDHSKYPSRTVCINSHKRECGEECSNCGAWL